MSNISNSEALGWDVVNWSKAIKYWEKKAILDTPPLKCLEIGANFGGLSFWLASKGHEVVCSDLENPQKNAEKLHQKNPNWKVKYEAINALDIPYENEFDIVIFKSILGGISRNGADQNKKAVIDQIHKSLKSGGKLLFAENLEASPMHIYLRKKFIKWGDQWNYLKLSEVDGLFGDFSHLDYSTAGFLGAFGRSEAQRQLFGKLDIVTERLVGKKNQYIVFGVATK